MEYSDAATVEYLRAQLLSERSISKVARQRVEELAKRVVELEEQLRAVTLQRKKAENAMAEVLISLEKNGFSYFSEAIRSGSDNNGIDTESKISNNSGREFCTSPSRSLTQKECNCLNHSGKTHGDRCRRRTSSPSSGGSTPKALGKSISQTEHGENRAEVVEEVPNSGFYHNGRDINMEIALEEQAQFIGQHEAEEKAQKEWEEKFRGNSNCTLDSQPAEKIASQDQGVKPNGFPAAANTETECSQSQHCSSTVSSESPSEFPGFSISNQRSIEANPNWKQQQQEGDGLEHKPLHVLPGQNLAQNSSSSHKQANLLKGESSGSKNKLRVKIPSEKANGLGTVLDALQSAKLSLSNKLSRSPFSKEDRQLGRALELESPVPVPAIRPGNGMDLPVGYVRRPHRPAMDLQSNMSSSHPGFRMYHPEMGVAVSAGNQLVPSHWMDPKPRISTLRHSFEPHLYTEGTDPSGYGQHSHTPPHVDFHLMQPMPSHNQISRPLPSNGMKRLSYSLYNDHSRSMMQ